jgi:hypothetical protein
MSDLFEQYPGTSQAEYDKFAEEIVSGPVRALNWQGCYSYTIESLDERTIIQFRSGESPLNPEMTALAKSIHPNFVPAMEYLGTYRESPIEIWRMEKIAGVGFLEIVSDEDIITKILNTAEDMAV